MTAVAGSAAARIKQLEFIVLCLLLVVLPILEAPKNIALALFLLLRVARALAERRISLPRPDPVELATWGLVLAAAVSTAVNWPFANGDKGLKDVLSYSLVFLIVYRERYTVAQKYLLFVTAAAGLVVGLVWGVLEVLQGTRPMLELHSVGSVTHSAMYVGIVVLMALGMALYAGDGLRGADSDRRVRERRYWWVVASLSLLGLFAMASRGGILATGFVLLLVLLLLRRKDLWIALALMVAACATIVSALPNVFDQARFATRTKAMVFEFSTNRDLGVRASHWRVAIAQATQGGTLLFGVGPRNFSGIDLSKLRFDRPVDIPGNKLTHPHNLFLTKLVEEGLFGLAAMLALFLLVAKALVEDWRSDRWKNELWLSGLGALVVPVVSGFFGTPWFNEHALLAMIVFALYLSSRNPDREAVGGHQG